MTWLLLALTLGAMIAIFIGQQSSERVAVAPVVDGPPQAVEFYWRPG